MNIVNTGWKDVYGGMAYAVKTTIVIPNTIVKFTVLRVALQFYDP